MQTGLDSFFRLDKSYVRDLPAICTSYALAYMYIHSATGGMRAMLGLVAELLQLPEQLDLPSVVSSPGKE